MILGNENKVTGDKNIINGHKNTVTGDQNQVTQVTQNDMAAIKNIVDLMSKSSGAKYAKNLIKNSHTD